MAKKSTESEVTSSISAVAAKGNYKVLHALSYHGVSHAIGAIVDTTTWEDHVVGSLIERGIIAPLSPKNPKE